MPDYYLDPDIAFVQTDKDALRNIVLAQGTLLALLEGLFQTIYAENSEAKMLFDVVIALQGSVEHYLLED
jgi:hypothetical protein